VELFLELSQLLVGEVGAAEVRRRLQRLARRTDTAVRRDVRQLLRMLRVNTRRGAVVAREDRRCTTQRTKQQQRPIIVETISSRDRQTVADII